MQRILREVLSHSGGLVSRRSHPKLAHSIDSAVRRHELVPVLPGVYAHPDIRQNWRALARAVGLWNPNAVIVGEAAAALTFWPDLAPTTIEVASPHAKITRPGFRFTRRAVPAALRSMSGGISITSPALTAIDVVPIHGGDAIDRALRTRMATLPMMYEALGATPRRRHNPDRLRMLLDSRDEPWSGGERLAHRLFRQAGITGWHANVPIVCDGNTFFMDIAMDDCPVVFEVDGKVHMRPEHFDHDRWRGNLLLLAGKYVYRFTWFHLDSEPESVVDIARRAIERHTD